MRKTAAFRTKYLEDGHLSVPKDVAASLLLKKGDEVQVVLGKERFDKRDFLKLFGVWKDKSEEEIDFYHGMVKERERFGRGEFEL